MVVSQTEEPRWKQLSIDFMSEESDNESDVLAVVVHRLTKRMCKTTVRPLLSVHFLCLVYNYRSYRFFIHIYLMNTTLAYNKRWHCNGTKPIETWQSI